MLAMEPSRTFPKSVTHASRAYSHVSSSDLSQIIDVIPYSVSESNRELSTTPVINQR